MKKNGKTAAIHWMKQAEALFGVTLPEDYKSCIRVSHGGRPRSTAFAFDDDSAQQALRTQFMAIAEESEDEAYRGLVRSLPDMLGLAAD